MCGVGGIYLPGEAVIQDEHRRRLALMGQAMRQRGPDAEGIYGHKRVGLVHRRLSIIDLEERSNQPMEGHDWVISYNGEIYNFAELRDELVRHYEFRTASDSEVLLAALEVWGLKATLNRIAGMFAFLAFQKSTELFYAVRDHMGIKPLLMGRTLDGGWCFASSATALLRSMPERRWSIFKPALASAFVLGAPFTRSSVFQGVERIDPASYVCCEPNGRMTTHRYWRPAYSPDFTIEDLISIVGQYGVSDVPSALFLSGGIDSTFLATAIKDLDCFHLVSPEIDYARTAARRMGRTFKQVKPKFKHYQEDLAQVIDFHGEPLMSCGIPCAVSRAVAQSGYKMAISANGADELFHGYPRTPMPEHRPDYLPLHETKTYTFFAEQLSHIFRDSRNFSHDELQDHIPSLYELGQELVAACHLSEFPPSASHRWLELMTYVLHDLNPTLDASSMLHSCEVRVPFLDHRVVQGVLSWPASQLVTAKLGRKAPLKAALAKEFPIAFFNRPKLGFSIDNERLGKIANLGPDALNRAKAKGKIKLNSDKRFGEYLRDKVYLGNSCHAVEVWQRSELMKAVA